MPSKSKLKIGLVLDSSLDLEDGVQQYVMAVGEWLRGRGHDVHYLVGQTKHRQLPHIHSLSKNLVVKFNGNRVDLPLWADKHTIRELMERERFDVLHVQTPHHPLLAQRVILAAGPKTAVLATFHILPYGWFAGFANRLLGIWLRPSLRRIDQMLAVTPVAATFEEKTFGLSADVLPNVFNYPLFKDAQPFERYESGLPVVLFLGRLVPRKGSMQLLEAVNILKRQKDAPGFRVLICGKGPLLAKLKAYVAENHLEETVEFTGFVTDEDKPRYYASSKITVFPSSGGESFGIVLLEGMASGHAAVLAGDNPGYRSVMESEPGLLFDALDPKELARLIRHLLTDEIQRRTYASWGSEYTQRFDVAVVGKELESLYYRLHRAKKL
jgi:phosphatidylinositol alpha-mannosyltransferase